MLIRFRYLISIASFVVASYSFGQSAPSSTSDHIPLDPKVRSGQLTNGLKYFIRKNNTRPGKVVLQLVVNAGYYHEEAGQLGVAHLVEHLGFSRLKHFPEPGSFKRFLSRNGLEFGADCNGGTGIETTFLITLPSRQQPLLDSGFFVVKDWAQGILFSPADVENEREIVLNELLSKDDMDYRVTLQQDRLLRQNNNYTSLQEEVNNIRTVSYDKVEQFYSDWYRPDAQAVIVEGDIDPETAEKKIIALFSDLRPPDPGVLLKTADIQKWQVSLDGKNKVNVVQHKQITETKISIFYKTPGTREGLSGTSKNPYDFEDDAVSGLFMTMAQDRIDNLVQQYNALLLRASIRVQNQSLTRIRMVSTVASLKNPDHLKPAFTQIFTELERLRRFGFTEIEFGNARKKIRRAIDIETESNFNTNLSNYFSDGAAAPSLEMSKQLRKELLDAITLAQVNRAVPSWMRDTDRDIIIQINEQFISAQVSTVNIDSIVQFVQQTTLEPSAISATHGLTLLTPEEVSNIKGAIVSRRKDVTAGATILKLSNGLEVVIKKLALESPDFFIGGYRSREFPLYSTSEDSIAASNIGAIAQHSGVGSLNKFQLASLLSNRLPYYAPFEVTSGYTGVSQYGRVENMEMILQLIYLLSTAPRKDSSAFEDWKDVIKNNMQTPVDNPANRFWDTVNRLRNEEAVSNRTLSVADINRIDLSRVFELYQECFMNPDGRCFIVYGNFVPDSIIPLLTKYLGGIPAAAKKIILPVEQTTFRKPLLVDKIIYGRDESLAGVNMYVNGKLGGSSKERVILEVLRCLLDLKIRIRIREIEGGSYDTRADLLYPVAKRSDYSYHIRFDCLPEKADYLTNAALEEVFKLGNATINQDDFVTGIRQVREMYKRRSDANWDTYLKEKYREKNNKAVTPDEYERILNQLTLADIRKTAAQYLLTNNYQRFVFMPKAL